VNTNSNNKRQIKFEGNLLYLFDGKETIVLGKINTRQGHLTRKQKLLAVQKAGEWAEI
jgi:hypothetical protein